MRKKVMIGIDEHTTFIPMKKGEKYLVGEDEHAIFIGDRPLTMKDVDKKLDAICEELGKEDNSVKTKIKAFFLGKRY